MLSLESPQGMNRFGLLREVLENTHPDPSEVLAGLGAVTPRTSSASRRS